MIFFLELEISGVAVEGIHQTATNGDFCFELLSKNDFEAVLVTFCCYDHGAKASEEIQKIATDQKEYISQMLLVCYNLLNSQNINNEKWLVTG